MNRESEMENWQMRPSYGCQDNSRMSGCNSKNYANLWLKEPCIWGSVGQVKSRTSQYVEYIIDGRCAGSRPVSRFNSGCSAWEVVTWAIVGSGKGRGNCSMLSRNLKYRVRDGSGTRRCCKYKSGKHLGHLPTDKQQKIITLVLIRKCRLTVA